MDKKRVTPAHHDLKKRREQRQKQAEETLQKEIQQREIQKREIQQRPVQQKSATHPKSRPKQNKQPKGKILEYRKPTNPPKKNLQKNPKSNISNIEDEKKEYPSWFQDFINEIIISGKILGGLALVGIAVFIYFMFIRPNSYRIYIGDYHVSTIPMGLINQYDFVTNMTAVIASRAGTNVYILEDVYFRRANTRGESLSIDQALTTTTNSVSYLVEAGSFFVNGNHIVTVGSMEQANDIINQIATNMIPENSQIVDIQINNGQVSSSFIDATNIVNFDTAFSLLTQTTRENHPHVVSTGEALWSIANLYGITIGDIVDLNPGLTTDSFIVVGQVIIVAADIPLLDITTTEHLEIFENIPAPIEHFTNPSLGQGQTNIVQVGIPGQIRRVYTVVRQNGFERSRELIQTEYLLSPVPYRIEVG